MIPTFDPPPMLRRWFLRREIAVLENPEGRHIGFQSFHTWPSAFGLLLLVFSPLEGLGTSVAILLLAILLLLIVAYLSILFFFWGRPARALLTSPGTGRSLRQDPIAVYALLHARKAELAALTTEPAP
ncbi:MAG: hypothetical protein AAF919_18945 [Pseudomonadota bacterium]